jgi:hypothetical protein
MGHLHVSQRHPLELLVGAGAGKFGEQTRKLRMKFNVVGPCSLDQRVQVSARGSGHLVIGKLPGLAADHDRPIRSRTALLTPEQTTYLATSDPLLRRDSLQDVRKRGCQPQCNVRLPILYQHR